jgi:diacylglycerol kinase (ATP)
MKKLIASFRYAFKGLAYATRSQLNFRIHLVLTAVAVLLGWILHISTNEWLWITLCITLVLSAELLNTALEALTDLVSPEFNVKAGNAKDVAAAAVTITALFAIITAGLIFVPKIFLQFNI